VDSLDEGWFLRGQAYEANSAARDIRKALGAYQTLVSAFPESSRWNEADARIRYIKQYYLGR
jgi:outer membrane protein assembly factor BamD (BamD/ComL family)